MNRDPNLSLVESEALQEGLEVKIYTEGNRPYYELRVPGQRTELHVGDYASATCFLSGWKKRGQHEANKAKNPHNVKLKRR